MTRNAIASLIPVRFLTIIAHLALTISLFWTKDANLRLCLPTGYTQAQYTQKDLQLTIGVAVALGLIAIELLSFVSGISIFNVSCSLFSIVAHTGAAFSLSFYIINAWNCDTFWYILAFCCALPAFVEICVIFAVSVLKAR